MTIVVRGATEADLDVLVPLNQVVQSVHANLYPNDFPQTVDSAVLRTLLAPRLASILIAEIDAISKKVIAEVKKATGGDVRG